MHAKPYSAASERNREPILAVLRQHFSNRQRVLEIGSGTGQHAVHFAAALPQLIWQTSERPGELPGLRLWLDEAALPNTPAPLNLGITPGWAARVDGRYDALFSANTLHIMAWEEVETLFAGLPSVLTPGAVVAIYGPFNDNGRFTSPSNAAFDATLRTRAAHMGLRDLQAVDRLAAQHGLQLQDDVDMPAHNRCRVWRDTRSA